MNKYTDTEIVTAYIKGKLAQARMDRAKAELDAYKGVLSSRGSGKHTVTDGESTVTFTVSENNTYSDERITTALLPGQFQRASTRKLDRAKVRTLYPHIYASAKTFVGWKVSL